jgi:hypothetical protein
MQIAKYAGIGRFMHIRPIADCGMPIMPVSMDLCISGLVGMQYAYLALWGTKYRCPIGKTDLFRKSHMGPIILKMTTDIILKAITRNFINDGGRHAIELSINHILIGAYVDFIDLFASLSFTGVTANHNIPPFLAKLLEADITKLLTPRCAAHLREYATPSVKIANYIYLIDPAFADKDCRDITSNIISICAKLIKKQPLSCKFTQNTLSVSYADPSIQKLITYTADILILPIAASPDLITSITGAYSALGAIRPSSDILITYYDMSGQYYSHDPVLTYMHNSSIFAVSSDCFMDFGAAHTCPLLDYTDTTISWHPMPLLTDVPATCPFAAAIYKYVFIDKLAAGLTYILPYLTHKTLFNVASGVPLEVDSLLINDDPGVMDNVLAGYIRPLIEIRMKHHPLLFIVNWYMATDMIIGRAMMIATPYQLSLIDLINADIGFLTIHRSHDRFNLAT